MNAYENLKSAKTKEKKTIRHKILLLCIQPSNQPLLISVPTNQDPFVQTSKNFRNDLTKMIYVK